MINYINKFVMSTTHFMWYTKNILNKVNLNNINLSDIYSIYPTATSN